VVVPQETSNMAANSREITFFMIASYIRVIYQ